jgi:hypothetical protein
MFIRVEKPCLHKYVVPNGSNFLTVSSCAVLKAFATFDFQKDDRFGLLSN